ncbi:hypothetical protein CcCBS67573_g03079 [Chytriomyces confervae]|uniref:DUF4436 domain-containing protein n=1 Tax=Chytriomyces confervae TaxID=246404 RepID=A0A507FH98_9FUNG|nr:hypothetical protein CcCBS67573_g03079 [Chytriomyces confervae]
MIAPRLSRVQIAVAVSIVSLLTIIGAIIGISVQGVRNANPNVDAVDTAVFREDLTDTLFIDASAVHIDLNAQTMKYLFSMKLTNDLAADNSRQSLYYETAVPINLTFGSQTYTYTKGSVLTVQTVTVPITGDPSLYPFDKWFSYVQVTELDAYADINITRSKTTKALAILIAVAMWALSLCSVALAITLWAYEKKVEPPFIVFTAALLFALPGLRNAMPAAPAMGVLVDQIVLVWGMALLSMSLVVYYLRFITSVVPAKPYQAVTPSAA